MLWYTQAGTPELAARRLRCRRPSTAELASSRCVPPTPGQPSKKPMQIPLAAGIDRAERRRPAARLEDGRQIDDGVIEVTEARQASLPRCACTADAVAVARLLGAGSASTSSLDGSNRVPDDHDSDPFNRWQAAQTYATNLLTHAALATAGKPEAVTGKEAIRLCLKRSAPPVPRLLVCPRPIALSSSSCRAKFDIARELARNVDPDAVRKAYEIVCARRLGTKSFVRPWREIYDAAAPAASVPSRLTPRAPANARSVLATLDLLVATGDTAEIERGLATTREASKHDRCSSPPFSILLPTRTQKRDGVLADFYAALGR